ncbi:NACHT domain-containing protein [Leifsonia sp. fls2-241-R2A-40a]|uniref:NACHT domain-containing protein n=1 Tax=Leifsonia sp. fls2-241-R2A-40a TaxID=3040290 RepID=UPI00254DA28C|nr:NACHT domain-containing protein [Leifsonia sp. fls2-241-R2A-40a]
MSILGVLVPVGLCAVKVALRLASNPAGGDWADSLADFSDLYGRVSNELDRRKLDRQAADIANEVTRHLAREIEIEYGSLDEGDVTAAAEAAVVALVDSLPLDRQDQVSIVAAEYSANALYKVVMRGVDRSSWVALHGEAVADLTQLILRNVSHAIAAILRKRPDLNIDMLSALVNKNAEFAALLDELSTALIDLPMRFSETAEASASQRENRQDLEFLTEYLRAVAEENDRLDVYGLNLSREVVHYELTASYVTLRLSHKSTEPSAGSLSRFLSRSAGASTTGEKKSSQVVHLSGPAGSGKTTLLQWLAVNAARGTLPKEYGAIAERLPVLIRLRNYGEERLPRVADLARATTASTLSEEPLGWMSRILRGGQGVLLLVDGVDEFPEKRAPELATWFEDLDSAIPRLTVVVSGRPTAEASVRALAEEFGNRWNLFEIQPLGRTEVQAFVAHWHRAVARRSGVGELNSEAMVVADRLNGDPALRKLASSPLVCAVLCALFHAQHGDLPSSRIELYNTLATVLVSARDSQRGILVDQDSLSGPQRLLVLQALASFMLENRLSEIPKDRAGACVRRALADIPGGHDAKTTLDALLRRSGVLREPSPGVVDFVHRTFLEFFAARELARRDSLEGLAHHADDPNWSETVVLAASIANDTQYRSMCDIILAKSDEAPGVRSAPWAVGVMGGILAARSTRVDSVDSELLKRLRLNLPPRSGDDARTVIAAGEAVFGEVVASISDPNNEVEPNVCSAVVRALGEFGGESALRALAEMPSRLRLQLVNDLAAIWPWFDPGRFAELLLQDLKPPFATRVVVNSSRVFPSLRGLSDLFEWEAVIEIPDESLITDCANAPIVKLNIAGLELLADESARTCEFVAGIAGLRALRVQGVSNLNLADADLFLLNSIDLGITRGEIDLSILAGSKALDLVAIASLGTTRMIAPRSTRIVSRVLSLSGEIEISPELQLAATQVYLKQVPAAALASLDLGQTSTLHLRDIDDLTSLDLVKAQSLRHLQIESCPALQDIEDLLSIDRLGLVEIRGATSITNAETLARLDEQIETFVLDVDLDALLEMHYTALALKTEDADDRLEARGFGRWSEAKRRPVSGATYEDWDPEPTFVWRTSEEDSPTEEELRSIELGDQG